jgi:hypothetical protein
MLLRTAFGFFQRKPNPWYSAQKVALGDTKLFAPAYILQNIPALPKGICSQFNLE